MSFGHSLKNEIKHLHAHSAIRVTHIIIDRQTHKVDFQRAEQIAQRTGMNIYIQTPERQWSSAVEPIKEKNYQFKAINFDRAPFKKTRSLPLNINVAESFNYFLYKVVTPNATLFIELEKNRRKLNWHFFTIVGLFLFLLYLAIRYQFAPVAEIKRVVAEVSKGNFKARTETTRSDDLGQLALQVNKMAEDIDRSMESKRSLLLSISHELRTPLTRAKISSEMIEDSKNRDSMLEDIAEMESIITDLIETEKLSEDKALARQATDINGLISQVIKESFQENSIDFTPLPNSPYVNIDPIRVKLLVKNLLKNALQYSTKEANKPKVILSLKDQYLNIDIIDEGIGMPEDLLDRLTEPFYRLDQARQRKTGGFGLGLYLCQAIINAHNGKLTFKSGLGQGTHVIAELSLS